jgi:DNA polymerase-3 subunit delta'
MAGVIQPWLAASWQRLVALGERLPHALLFSGPAGLGKRELALALSARLLCDQPREDGHACGVCGACALRLAGNHPDELIVLPPAEEQAEDEGNAATAEEGKAKSRQILIEQIRALHKALEITSHGHGRRVIIIDPAEAMNAVTANGLLKLLEEPPQGCVFVLISSAPRRLLPTIRSRCQVWSFAPPNAAELAAWPEAGKAEMAALLAVKGGLPLAASRAAQKGQGAMLQRFTRDVLALQRDQALRIAAEWEKWLKSADAKTASFGMVQLTDWMLRWVTDLASVRLGGVVRYFPAQAAQLARLAEGLSVAAAVNCYNDMARIHQLAEHSLNARLVLDDMLLRYVRVLTGTRR